MVTYDRKSQKLITITILHGKNSHLRQIQNIVLSDTLSTEAVLFPSMQISIAVSNRPLCWSKYYRLWVHRDITSAQQNPGAPIAQILVGADATHFSQASVNHSNNYLIQSGVCRLMKSAGEIIIRKI